MPQVPNDEFVKQLQGLFEVSQSGKGSVYLEQKRLTRTGPDSVLHATAKPFPLVFRATNGARDRKNRVTVSTIVEVADLSRFWNEYTQAFKKGSGGLRKKDKKKAKKAK